MKSKLLHEATGARTFAVVLDEGDEVVASLTSFASTTHVGASHFTAIGAAHVSGVCVLLIKRDGELREEDRLWLRWAGGRG